MRSLRNDEREEEEESTTGYSRRVLLNLGLVFASVAAAETSRGIVVPTLYQYNEALGGTSLILGVMVAVFSGGRLVAAPALGWLSSGPFQVTDKVLFSVSTFICIVGNLLYGLGFAIEEQSSQATALAVVVASRLILGFATGILGIARAHVAAVTTTLQRTSCMSLLNAAQFVGFSMTPIIGALLCQSSLDYNKKRGPDLYLNCLTSPGFLLSVANAVLFVVFVTLFYQPPTPEESDKREDDKDERPPESRPWMLLILFMVLNGISRGAVSVLETLGAELFQGLLTGRVDTSDDNLMLRYNGYFFCCVGALGVIAYLVVYQLGKRGVSDYSMTVFGLIAMILGALCLIQTKKTDEERATWFEFVRFAAGCVFVWSMAMPLTTTSVVSMFSKALPREKQGGMMGLFTAFGSIGRIVLPIIAGATGTIATFCIVASLGLISLIGVVKSRSRLRGYTAAATNTTTTPYLYQPIAVSIQDNRIVPSR